METIDFTEKKAEKLGAVTPKALINNLLDELEKDEIEVVTYVVKNKEGEIYVGYSQGEQSGVIGILECGKQQIIEDMRE